MQGHTRPHQRRSRSGFTLVELLMVIIIIALLIGLLLPALSAAIRRSREAAVSADINAMAQALAQFKSTYGDYPPSRIILSETGDYSAGTLGTNYAGLASRSIAALRKFWPRIQLSTAGAIGSGYDFNGDNQVSGVFVLTGDECLVFFLGGIPTWSSSVQAWAMTGFGKNPANPFQNSTTTSNRYPPLFDFKSDRLTDIDNDTFPEYKDTIDTVTNNGQYVYFSSYAGVGYDPDDVNYIAGTQDGPQYTNYWVSSGGTLTTPTYPGVNFPELDAAQNFGQTSLLGGFMVSNAATPKIATTNTARTDWVASTSPNPYVADDPIPISGTSYNTADNRPRNYVNPQTFQLFSPGSDRYYGIGGTYNPKNTATTLPFTTAEQAACAYATGQTFGTYSAGDLRSSTERDNLTNFAASRLDP